MILSGIEAANDLYTKLPKFDGNLQLAAILIGDNPASQVYLRIKAKKLNELGLGFQLINLEASSPLEKILEEITKLNEDQNIKGIIIQLPLPGTLGQHTREIINHIDPKKDVDCLHTQNLGSFYSGESDFMPATAQGVIDLLTYYGIDMAGQHAVIIGRSNLVSKPLAFALLQKNATITICHSYTKNLSNFTREADIVISAVGKPRFLTQSFFREGQTVIDIGINRDQNNKLCGDVDFETVSRIVAHITPVPGGVGPMTVYGLVKNLIRLATNN